MQVGTSNSAQEKTGDPEREGFPEFLLQLLKDIPVYLRDPKQINLRARKLINCPHSRMTSIAVVKGESYTKMTFSTEPAI